MTVLSPGVAAFLDDQPVGVLGTKRSDGSVRQSVVYHVRDGDRLLISTEGKRAKAGDVEREGWASYCVLAHERPFPSVTVEGPARIVTEGIGEPHARLFAVITEGEVGEAASDEDLAALDRVLLELTVERAYGVSHFEG